MCFQSISCLEVLEFAKHVVKRTLRNKTCSLYCVWCLKGCGSGDVLVLHSETHTGCPEGILLPEAFSDGSFLKLKHPWLQILLLDHCILVIPLKRPQSCGNMWDVARCNPLLSSQGSVLVPCPSLGHLSITQLLLWMALFPTQAALSALLVSQVLGSPAFVCCSTRGSSTLERT